MVLVGGIETRGLVHLDNATTMSFRITLILAWLA